MIDLTPVKTWAPHSGYQAEYIAETHRRCIALAEARRWPWPEHLAAAIQEAREADALRASFQDSMQRALAQPLDFMPYIVETPVKQEATENPRSLAWGMVRPWAWATVGLLLAELVLAGSVIAMLRLIL